MDAPTDPSQPPQPPKQAAYNQSSNPVSQSQQEQRTTAPQPQFQSRSAIHRGPGESVPAPSSHHSHLQADVAENSDNNLQADPEYGVEQQPPEGEIAAAVENKSRHGRQQAGAHAGPVGSAAGPGYSGVGEQPDLMSDLGRKTKEHHQRVDQKSWKGAGVGREQDPNEALREENEHLRQKKMQQEEDLDVKGAVGEGSGDPVVA